MSDIMLISLPNKGINQPFHCQRTEHDNVQRLQGLDPRLGRDSACDERKDRASRLAEPSNPSNGTGEDPARDDAPRVVHRDGIYGAQQQADERYCYGVPD